MKSDYINLPIPLEPSSLQTTFIYYMYVSFLPSFFSFPFLPPPPSLFLPPPSVDLILFRSCK